MRCRFASSFVFVVLAVVRAAHAQEIDAVVPAIPLAPLDVYDIGLAVDPLIAPAAPAQEADLLAPAIPLAPLSLADFLEPISILAPGETQPIAISTEFLGCELDLLIALAVPAPETDLLLPATSLVTAVAGVLVQPVRLPAPVEQTRPTAMLPLYAGYALLQVLDYASTRHAIAGGFGREANPLVAPVAGSGAGLFALKAVSSAGVLLAGERIWKRNRVGAIVFMAAANGALAVVVTHNYSVGRPTAVR